MVTSDSYFFGAENWTKFSELVSNHKDKEVFILCDSNTELFCLPIVLNHIPGNINIEVYSVKPGDASKSVENAIHIWNWLNNHNATNKSLLLCVGGGVVTDLGHFAASLYKRGMRTILLPTSLLGMVDAALGGKNGVNFNGIKNQIGTINTTGVVFVFPEFLITLPKREKLSGSAEMLKHALLEGKETILEFLSAFLDAENYDESLIFHSARIKLKVVKQDVFEENSRKILNLGHTIGHSLEAFSQKYDSHPLTHGEAIAAGLICELYISWRMLNFPLSDLEWIANIISWHFPVYKFRKHASNELFTFMLRDKKNRDPLEINFTLLKAIGEPVINQIPGEKLIRESLHFYLNLESGIFPSHSGMKI